MKFSVNIEMSRDFIVHKLMLPTIRSTFVLFFLSISFAVSAFALLLLSHQRRFRHFDHVENCAKNKVVNSVKEPPLKGEE